MSKIFFFLPVFILSNAVLASSASAQKYTITIESAPSGQTINLYKVGKDKVDKSCKTPCEFKLKSSKEYRLTSTNDAGETLYLPVNAPMDRDDPFDISVHFKPNDPSATTLTIVRDAAPDTIYPRGDKPPRPLVRLPGQPPQGIGKSGHCEMVFDMQETGRPTNIRAKSCSDYRYAPVSIETVARFKYRPQGMRDGDSWKAVYSTGEESKLTYQITDEAGNLIPE